jgi:ubiquinone/menaquinone biosynthesis C-methylase UbiE
MERQPEPELMDAVDQARAYAKADFSASNSLLIQLFQQHFPGLTPHRILDLGCGPADICIRLANTFADAEVTGVDGADAMLEFAREAIGRSPARTRIHVVCDRIQRFNDSQYDVVVSNSLLHHLADPDDLWHAIRRLTLPGAAIMVMDLMRPPTRTMVDSIVDTHAGNEPEILRQDFRNSLCAAFTPDEVSEQLRANDLAQLSVEVVSDRHLLVSGRLE